MLRFRTAPEITSIFRVRPKPDSGFGAMAATEVIFRGVRYRTIRRGSRLRAVGDTARLGILARLAIWPWSGGGARGSRLGGRALLTRPARGPSGRCPARTRTARPPGTRG